MPQSGKRRAAKSFGMLVAAAAIGGLPIPGFANDLPPTPEGAQKLSDVFATYLGRPVAGAPSPVTVTVEGAHYAAALDLANLAAPFSGAGFSIDPAIARYALTEQDDGTWRVAGDALPSISAHFKDATIAYQFEGYRFEGIFDPTLPGFRSGETRLDKARAEVQATKVSEALAIGAAHATVAAAPAANGAVSLVAHNEIADVSAQVATASDAAATPVSASLQIPTTLADVKIDGAPIRKLLDLWAFVVAHPSRAEIAANEQAFKGLLRAAIPVDLKLAEKIEMKQIAVESPQGRLALASAKLGLAMSNAAGAKGASEYDFAMDGVTWPAGLLSPAFSDLAPTAFNIDVKLSGLEFGAGAEEAIADMHFDGDGPVISEADRAQISAKAGRTAPLTIDLLPSHVVAPQIDVVVEGQLHLEGARPSGVVKVRVRHFDKTVAALKALGPLASPQILGGLALARTLGKAEADDVLVWVGEYSPDGAMKVNGLPLGKAPQ